MKKDYSKSAEKLIEAMGGKENIKKVFHCMTRLRFYVKDKNKTVLVVTHNFISKCIWILENHIQSPEQINRFFHSNDEIKYYPGRSAEKDFDGR